MLNYCRGVLNLSVGNFQNRLIKRIKKSSIKYSSHPCNYSEGFLNYSSNKKIQASYFPRKGGNAHAQHVRDRAYYYSPVNTM